MNTFVKSLLDALGITEEETDKISKIMDAYGYDVCFPRDVLQPALKGEKVGKTLLPLMEFKSIEAFCKKTDTNIADLKPYVKDGHLEIGLFD